MGGTNRASFFFLEGVFQVLPWPGSIAFARAPPRALVRALKWSCSCSIGSFCWRCGVIAIRSGLTFAFRTKLGIGRRLEASRCIFAYDQFEMSCTHLSTKKENKKSRVVQPNGCLMSHVNYSRCAEPDPTCGAGHSTAVILMHGSV